MHGLLKKTGGLFLLASILGFALSAEAQQTSSINPLYPATDGDITSYGLRENFLAAYTDINTLFQDHNLPSIGANQFLGALTAGVPSGQTLPSCAGSTNALTYTQGIGFGCNVINPSGTGTVTSVGLSLPSVLFVSPVSGSPVVTSGVLTPTLATHSAGTFFSGPASGSDAQPGFRLITGTDIPLPSPSSLGGVNSFAPIAHNFVEGISTSGTVLFGPASFTDILGALAVSQSPVLAANQLLGSLTATNAAGISVPSCSSTNQALNWTAATGFGCVTISGSGSPTGSAGGDLGGTYPNPTVTGVGDVTTGNLPNANLSPLSANQILGAVTSTTPSGLSIPSCSGSTNAIGWQSGTGFICNTISGPQLNVAQSWTASQSGTPVSVTLSTSTFSTNFSAANNFNYALSHAACPCTIANPTNVTAGESGLLVVTQSATGSDTVGTWGSNFKFSGGSPPTLSTAANAVDTLAFYAVDSTHIQIQTFGLNFQ